MFPIHPFRALQYKNRCQRLPTHTLAYQRKHTHSPYKGFLDPWLSFKKYCCVPPGGDRMGAQKGHHSPELSPVSASETLSRTAFLQREARTKAGSLCGYQHHIYYVEALEKKRNRSIKQNKTKQNKPVIKLALEIPASAWVSCASCPPPAVIYLHSDTSESHLTRKQESAEDGFSRMGLRISLALARLAWGSVL